MNCKNCNSEVNQNYCPNCGQPSTLKRIDGHYITHEIIQVLNFEKGIFYTIKELIISPGKNVRAFLTENRNRLVKPIIFIIVTSLIYTVVNHYFHIEDQYVQFDEAKKTATGSIFKWIQEHYGYANILMSIFIAFFIKLFFRKSGYNFYEIIILLCFVMGIGMLAITLFALIQGITQVELMPIAGVLFLAYSTFAIADFFDKRKVKNYVKSLAAYMSGMITFNLLALALGIAIDTLINH